MELNGQDIRDEERGLISPCGIVCFACDIQLGESAAAASKIVEVWEGMNLLDAAPAFGMDAEGIRTTLQTLKAVKKRRVERGPCPGCNTGGGPGAICGIVKCVHEKGILTCAECEDWNPDSEKPCPHAEPDAQPMPIASRGAMSSLIRARYRGWNTENLQRCREIGYRAFIDEMKRKVEDGFRTWQIISPEPVFSKGL